MHKGDGTLAQWGYATAPLPVYNPLRVKTPQWRLKAWDYYFINDDEYALVLGLGDWGYKGIMGASIIDLQRGLCQTAQVTTPFSLGRYALPNCSVQGIAEFETKRAHIRFEAQEGIRKLRARFDRFQGRGDLFVEAILDEEPLDSAVGVFPGNKDPLAFLYRQDMVGMRVQGSFRRDLEVHGFQPSNSFAALHWGRGVWEQETVGVWGIAQGWQDGRGFSSKGSYRFGLTLGEGLDSALTTQEMRVFLDGQLLLAGQVSFHLSKKREGHRKKNSTLAERYHFMAPWQISDKEGKIALTFYPIADRIECRNWGIAIYDQHQVFGTFRGRITKSGTEFLIANLKGSITMRHTLRQ